MEVKAERNLYHVGDRDTTLGDRDGNICCQAETLDPDGYGPFYCTRLDGHKGTHAAGTGAEIVEVW